MGVVGGSWVQLWVVEVSAVVAVCSALLCVVELAFVDGGCVGQRKHC